VFVPLTWTSQLGFNKGGGMGVGPWSEKEKKRGFGKKKIKTTQRSRTGTKRGQKESWKRGSHFHGEGENVSLARGSRRGGGNLCKDSTICLPS